MRTPHRLPADDYLAFLHAESDRFVELLSQADPAAPVPSCPDWNASDLLWHLTEVQWFWGSIVSRALSDPEAAEQDKPERPDDYAALVDLQRRSTERLLTAVSQGEDSDPMWTWLDEDQTRGFTRRRQAHEALIHRLDAEQVAGGTTPLDPRLATDGVDEALRIMFGGVPSWGEFRWQAGPVLVVATDTGARWPAEVGRVIGRPPGTDDDVDEESLDVQDGRTADPVAQISGTASDLDTWLWGRAGAATLEGTVQHTGDEQALEAFGAVIGTGID